MMLFLSFSMWLLLLLFLFFVVDLGVLVCAESTLSTGLGGA